MELALLSLGLKIPKDPLLVKPFSLIALSA